MTDPVTSGCPPQILTEILSLLNHDCLSAFTTDSSGELYVLRHDGHTLGVNSAQVGVFKQTHQVGLACFLRTSPTKKSFNTACLQHPTCRKQETVLKYNLVPLTIPDDDHTRKNAIQTQYNTMCSAGQVSQLGLFIHTP